MTPQPESTARRYGKVFDEIAAEYDRRRPAYPDELIDQACQVAGIGSGDHVLEVGCGSGQLTRGILARGLHVTALEPGENLIALAWMEQRRGNVSEVWAWLGSYDIGRDYAARLFSDVQVAVMPKLSEYTPDEVNALVRTMSFYARLSPGQRQALEREYEAIYARLGRPIRASTVTALVTARRRTANGFANET